MSSLLRVFLDSNILFSASYSDKNRFLRIWSLAGVQPITSRYCICEVQRNIRQPKHVAAFGSLIDRTQVVADCPVELFPDTVMLPFKDLPVLAAAMHASADILLTGDHDHFGRFFGHQQAGVLIESPVLFWERFDPLPQ